MLLETQALEAAKREAAALSAEAHWTAAFDAATALLPVLVKNLTRPARHYYLVDFRKHGFSTGRMVVDANTGHIRQVTGISRESETLPRFLAPDEVKPPLGGEVDLEDGRRMSLPSTPFAKELVWMHSRESRTMFQPLYRLIWPGLTLYLRIDERYYDKLTPTIETPTPPPQR